MPTPTLTRRAHSLVFLLSAVLLAYLTPTGVHAQPVTGTVAGRVLAANGDPMPGAIVTVWNETIAVERRTTTGADGDYSIDDLPVQGIYVVRVELTGFGALRQSGISLIANERAIVDFTLRPTTEETLIVTGRVPVLEHERSAVQQVISEAMTHTLPLIGRDFIALATLTPGFSGNPNYPSPQGQSYWSNNVLVDGASHYSKWRGAARTFYSGYGLESIREVQVLTSQFSAEFGETLATVTSATTNSGTNEHHGSAMLFFQDETLSDIPPFSLEKTPFDSERFGVTLGGPLVQDRSHYFTSYEGRRARANTIVVSPAAPGTLARSDEDEHMVFLKADHKNVASDLLTLRYNGQWLRWHDERGGLKLAGTGTHYTNDVHTFLVSHTTLLSNAALNQFRVQFSRYRDVRTDIDPSLYELRSGYSEQGGILGPYGSGADPEDTWEAADTLSWKRGPHALKFGGGFKHVAAATPALAYGRGAYFFAGDPKIYPQPYAFTQALVLDREPVAHPRSLSGFGFFQDDWRARPNLTVNLGLRYDIERMSNIAHYDAPTDTNNLQPRLGVAWEPLDQRLVIRGGVGLYTQQHLLNYVSRVELEGPDGAATITLAPDANGVLPITYPNVLSSSAVATVPRDVYVLDPAFRNPHSLQATVGAEQSLYGVLFSADFVYLRGEDLMSRIDTNAPASFDAGPATKRSVADADKTRPTPPVPGGYRKIISLGNEGDSWYRGLQLKMSQSAGPVQTLVAYALGKSEDRANYDLPEDSRNLPAEKARADNDIRHNLSVGFVWQLPSGQLRALTGWTLSGLGQFRSSRPYTVTFGDDGNGTTQSDARPGGRNTAHGDTYSTIDLALAKQFHAGGRIIEVRGEAFNVLSTTNYDEYVGTLSSFYFSEPVTAFPRRRIQLAASFRF